MELGRQDGEQDAEDEDGERAAEPFEKAAVGNAHRPFAIGNAQFLLVRVPADLAMAIKKLSFRAVAGIDFEAVDSADLFAEDSFHHVLAAKGGIDERLDRARTGARRDIGQRRGG